MWLFTPHGFFSTVSAGPGQVCVRARLKKHLQNLAKFSGIPLRITSSKTTDYRYRTVLTQKAWAVICKSLAEQIDYPNFKAKVAAGADDDADEDYLEMLHDVWTAGYQLQQTEGK